MVALRAGSIDDAKLVLVRRLVRAGSCESCRAEIGTVEGDTSVSAGLEELTCLMRRTTSKWGQMVAQAWSDDSYKQRLLTDPAAVMAERGLTAPAGKQLRVVEDTADTVHVVLPARPNELSDEQLDQAAGGAYIASAPSTP